VFPHPRIFHLPEVRSLNPAGLDCRAALTYNLGFRLETPPGRENKETPMYEEQVTVIAYIEIKPGTEEAFKAELDKLIVSTRAESACVNYDFHQSVKQSTQFVAYENWTSMAGLDQHAKSAHIQTFRQNCAEMFVKPAEITIWKILN
jgi:quinol monooxygenase YgiN